LVFAAVLFPQMAHGRLLIKGILASDRSAIATEFSSGLLGAHERKVANSSQPTSGDGVEAKRLAKNFRRELKAVLTDVLRVDDEKNGSDWDSSRLRCHCFFNSGLVFIVREPGLAGFNDAALDTLSRSAWRVALDTANDSEQVEPDFPIAICVMGKKRCQTFVMGQTRNVDEDSVEPSYSGHDPAQVLSLLE